MEFDSILKKLDEIDQKYQDSNSVSQKALKDLGDEQHKYAKQLADVQAELVAMQKKSESYSGVAQTAVKSIGEQFVNTEGFKNLSAHVGDNKHVRETFSTKSATISTTSTGITDNFLGGVQDMGGIISTPQRKLVIESLIPHIPVTAGSMSMVKETSFTNNAGVVAEGGNKPESTFEFEKYNVNIETVAHWTKISEQLAADAPAVQAFINTRMQYGLQNKVDAQIISGTGSSGQLGGFLKSGNHYDYSPNINIETGDTLIDFVAKIQAELEASEYTPEYLILNPRTWTALTLLKDTQKRYLLGGPGSQTSKSLWGIPVVTTSAIASAVSGTTPTAAKYLLADFSLGSAILDRQELVVDIDRTQDDFIKNLLTIRVERRLALAILDNKAIAGGDLSLS